SGSHRVADAFSRARSAGLFAQRGAPSSRWRRAHACGAHSDRTYGRPDYADRGTLPVRVSPRRWTSIRPGRGVYLRVHLVASGARGDAALVVSRPALIAGLSAAGGPVGAAASAVLVYRLLLTYWLTCSVGFLSRRVDEGRSYV